MRNADSPAMPCEITVAIEGAPIGCKPLRTEYATGLTKREMLAKDAVIGEFKFNSIEDMATFIGRDADQSSMEDLIKASAACDAKIRVIYADALLAELGK